MEIWRKDDDVILLFKEISQSIQNNLIKEIEIILNKLNILKCIKIYNKIISTSVRQSTNNYKFKIEFTHVDELRINITKHSMQPKIIKCSDEDAKKIKEMFVYEMPKIKHIDPVIVWFNWNINDVIAYCYKKCDQLDTNHPKCCKDIEYRLIV